MYKTELDELVYLLDNTMENLEISKTCNKSLIGERIYYKSSNNNETDLFRWEKVAEKKDAYGNVCEFGEKSIGETIFSAGVLNENDSLDAIRAAVEKYTAEFNEEQCAFLKEYLCTVYILEYITTIDGTEGENSIDLAPFVTNICNYATNLVDLFSLINATGEIESFEDFINVVRYGDMDIPETVSRFMVNEVSIIEEIKLTDIFTYDELSRKIIFTVLCGHCGYQIRNAIASLMNKVLSVNDKEEGERKKQHSQKFREINTFINEYKPAEIIKYLDSCLIGQHEVKEQAALFLYKHCCRLIYPNDCMRENILIWGPTGTGKTEVWRRLRQIAPIPIEIVDAGAITSRGFQGADLTEIIAYQLGRDPDMRNGLLILDEIDKIVKPSHSAQGDDVSGAVQAAFLKVLEEGCAVDERGKIQNIPNMDFVLCGAFEGIEKTRNTHIGFGTTDDVRDDYASAEDFIKYGMMKELFGRISSIAHTEPLKAADYYKILSMKKNNPLIQLSNQYKVVDGISLQIRKSAKIAVSKETYEAGLGAREMFSIIKRVANKKYIRAIETGTKKIVITEKDIVGSRR